MPVERTSGPGRERLHVVDRERVAVGRLAALAAAVEPLVPLGGRAVREGVGVHLASRLLLEPIVADRLGRPDRLVDVAGVEVAGLEHRLRPYARVAVGLQLQPHGRVVRAVRIGAADPLDLRAGSQLLLDVVADLVRDHVRPGEVAARLQLALHVAVEREVQVDIPVFRAVERTDGGSRRPAAGVDALAVEHELCARVVAALVGERALPGRLDVVEHVGGELLQVPLRVLTGRDRLAARRARRGVEAGGDVESAGVAAQELDRDEDDHAHDPQAAADRQRRAAAAAAAAAHVDHIGRRCPPSPAHVGARTPSAPVTTLAGQAASSVGTGSLTARRRAAVRAASSTAASTVPSTAASTAFFAGARRRLGLAGASTAALTASVVARRRLVALGAAASSALGPASTGGTASALVARRRGVLGASASSDFTARRRVVLTASEAESAGEAASSDFTARRRVVLAAGEAESSGEAASSFTARRRVAPGAAAAESSGAAASSFTARRRVTFGAAAAESSGAAASSFTARRRVTFGAAAAESSGA